MLFFFLLLAGGGGAEGYKIRRTDCSMADTTVMVCTCGGIGDPYSIIMNKVRTSDWYLSAPMQRKL